MQLAARPLEEFGVFRVRPGVATLDKCDTEVIELFGDAELVVDRERDPLLLGSVSKRGVVDLHRGREPEGGGVDVQGGVVGVLTHRAAPPGLCASSPSDETAAAVIVV